MNLKSALTGQTYIQNSPMIQNATGTVAEVSHTLRGITVAPVLANPYSTELMGTSPLGYSVPNPTFILGIPSAKQIVGTPAIQWSDAPIQKGCGS